MTYNNLDTKTKRDTTRLFNLLNNYRDHIITIYLNKQIPSTLKENITQYIKNVDAARLLIQNNLD